MIIEPGCNINIRFFQEFIVDGDINKKICQIDTVNKTYTCYKEDSDGNIVIVGEDLDIETLPYKKIVATSVEGMALVLE